MNAIRFLRLPTLRSWKRVSEFRFYALILSTAAIFAGCANSLKAPSQPDERNSAVSHNSDASTERHAANSIFDIFLEISDTIPTFGGIYIDEYKHPVIMLSTLEQPVDLEYILVHFMGINFKAKTYKTTLNIQNIATLKSATHIIKCEYSFAELHAAYLKLLNHPNYGTKFLAGFEIKTNHIIVWVEKPESIINAQESITSLNIPQAMLVFQVQEKLNLDISLHDESRPISGGTRIANGTTTEIVHSASMPEAITRGPTMAS